MYPDFVYSGVWQVVLVFQVFLINTLEVYLIANQMLPLAKQEASVKQKLLFSFILGTIFQTALPLVVFYYTDSIGNEFLSNTLVILYPVIVGIVYYFAGVKILRLSAVRSIKMMGYVYVAYTFFLDLMNILVSLWPVPQDESFSFFSSIRTWFFVGIVIVAYYAAMYVIKRTKPEIRVADRVFINLKKEQFIYIIKLVLVFSFSTFLPLVMDDKLAAYLLIAVVLIMYLMLSLLIDMRTALQGEVENQEVHISLLNSGIDEIRGVKHDLKNILQPYSGYLEMGDLDRLKAYHASVTNLVKTTGEQVNLGRKMKENPALVSLLESKIEYSKQMKTNMDVTIECDITDLYIDNVDLCRCVACLLDNAIEAAIASEKKRVSFALESKANDAKLIIITNSTDGAVDIGEIVEPGVTTKQGHSGLGLQNVKSVLNTYGNCAFHLAYYNYEMVAYVELRKE